jgi:hypothetical protein
VWGAGLSTYTAAARHNEKRGHVKVRFTLAYPTGAGGMGPPHYNITAANTGDRPVTLNGVGIQLPGGQHVYVMSPLMISLPCLLQQGQSVGELVEVEEVHTQIRSAGFAGRVAVRGFFDDAVGSKHRSPPRTVTL